MGPLRAIRLSRFAGLVDGINRLEPTFSKLRGAELTHRSLALRYRVRSGEPKSRLAGEAFALVREAARREIGLRHFDVQLIGGLAMLDGGIAEMETGEGKTLAATLPLYLHGLHGRGSHLITANDYLAQRDAEWMRPVFRMLGLSVGVLQANSSLRERRTAYRCGVTYGTIREFGFDFLRDRLTRLISPRSSNRPESLFDVDRSAAYYHKQDAPLQRAAFFAVVDEADYILIDEARTPLIISAAADKPTQQRDAVFPWAVSVALQLTEHDHYVLDPELKSAELTLVGRRFIRNHPQDGAPPTAGLLDLFEAVERAVVVHRLFRRDREYLVRKGEVVLIDASTGRPGEGRKLRRGLHQAIEAAEEISITSETVAAAQVTVQSYVRRYGTLSGMTGTARAASRELRAIYRLPVIRIPTNRPLQRRRLPAAVLPTEDAKWEQVIQEVVEMSARVQVAGIEHRVLNARHLAAEADVVANAGQSGNVTVATNMAGRGTDIRLNDAARAAGGLHVISTEKHDAARVDSQLFGRCGRQGDPGTYREILSAEDRVIQGALSSAERDRLLKRLRQGSVSSVEKQFRKAQRRIERRHFQQRKLLMHVEQRRMQREQEIGLDYFLEAPE